MLLVYLEQLQQEQQRLLLEWTTFVHYWPRSWAHTDHYNAAIPTDWWLLFNQPLYATKWILLYPEHTRIIKTLNDNDS